MKYITIIEHINQQEHSLDWYDNDTGEFLRSYPERVLVSKLPDIQREMVFLRSIKVPTDLSESNLWC